MRSEILIRYGIDYETGLCRCMGDSNFYARLLRLFLADSCFQRAKAAYEKGDRAALFSCVHELKGACGNAALTPLYEAVCPLVEALRVSGEECGPIAPLFERMEREYKNICRGIKIALEEN